MTAESIYLKQHKYIVEGVIWRGTATGGAAGTLIDTDIPDTYEDDTGKDETLFIFEGTGKGQTRKISGYTKITRTFTVYDNWTTNPDTTSRYQVFAGGGSSGAGGGDATAANQATIIADTEKIYNVALGVPVADSLASFIAAGGVGLGTRLPDSKSLYDVIVLDRLAGGETEGTASPLNAFAGVATSGDIGADIFTIGLLGKRTKFHYLGIQISGLTNGAVATIRGYKKTTDAGAMREFYNQQFTVGTDPDEIPVINGTIAFRNDVRFEIKSNNAADIAVSVDYEYLTEVME